eukprot:CAMPEP_0113961348 /NCGR_PEP_ID=MMETSP0011_2-20120614/5252_1 /TAXON_ID=101924 /ORGANISM="Rhodosorus marinus" /LENGTH=468 /DNA_ID=CAMNT_0000972965 /DNA_START=199 /DNA_END=1605 /DNA_ORIENTATION=+ /assembly_acc=CAM_ASM_000156
MSSQNGNYDYDLFVIGAGSGGVRASRIAATHGAKVAVAEESKYGGTCVNVGCVPKKLFVYGSHYPEYIEEAKAFGWDMSVQNLDWPRLVENKNKEISRLNGIYGNILGRAGVEIIDGTATLKDEHTVAVGDKTYSAETILVATGGWPKVPDFPGREHVITSNEVFFLPDVPKRFLIVGGGYIAVEFANVFHGYGSEVTQLYRGDLFLRGFDGDVRKSLRDQMIARGIDVKFNTDVEKIEKEEDGTLKVTLRDGGILEVDQVMYATGRAPKSRGIGLEDVGVELGANGKIKVDEWGKTNIPNIYAIGDVTDRVQLTPVALAEGHCFADTLYGNKPRNVNYEYIPTAVFSNPVIGTCGLTEEEAREKYKEIDVYKADFKPMKHTLTGMGERTFMKLIVERETQKVVGCHILEPSAGEMIQLVGVAMKAGATKQNFDETIGVHPTAAEEMVTMRTKEPEPAVAEAAAAVSN